jgi:CubicO group peptidase (beta-lactamase class C family)
MLAALQLRAVGPTALRTTSCTSRNSCFNTFLFDLVCLLARRTNPPRESNMGPTKGRTKKGEPAVKIPLPDPQKLRVNTEIDKLVYRHIDDLRGLKDPKAGDSVPGAAVMVRQDNNVVHVKCYGFANLETGEEIQPTTVFELGSLSKQFTALAALAVLEEAELELPITKFFRSFPRYGDKIKIKDLIHHTSGVPDYAALHVGARGIEKNWYTEAMRTPDDWYPQMENRREREHTNRDALRWIASQKLLPHRPGFKFDYSNSGYVLLAQVVERKTGKRLADLLRELLFDPLGMEDTYMFDEARTFPENARQLVNHAKCYNHVRRHGFVPVGYTPLNFIYGDGNVHSTILDMATWDVQLHRLDYATLCSRPEPGGNYVDLKKFRDLIWSPVKIHNKQVDYGAGWNLLRARDSETVEENGRTVSRRCESSAEFHRGEWLGWRSYIARATRGVLREDGSIDPKTWQTLGVVVLSNIKQLNPCNVAQDISKLYWGRLKKDNIMNRFNCG